ncbi:MAG: NAD(P)H-dependent glycerol-3-phosphate dehydrogenase [Pseudomonadota bacterium]
MIGAGAWGTALAVLFARQGMQVHLLTRSAEKARFINEQRANERSLPGVRLPDNLTAHHGVRNTPGALDQGIIVLAVPAQETRKTIEELAPILARSPAPSHAVIVTAKGIERRSNRLMCEIIREVAPDAQLAVLSGPSFAHDVARDLPTAVTLAADDLAEAQRLCGLLGSKAFRPYASDDLIGVQLGGALKNVIAIAAGAVEGKGLGESAKAALIARGFAEMSRLAVAMGGRAETLAGLSGLGDLVLTCSTAGSRNFRFGQSIGRDVSVSKLMQTGQPLAEGAQTASAALAMGRDHGIELPIIETVTELVNGHLTVDDAITRLMSRPIRAE